MRCLEQKQKAGIKNTKQFQYKRVLQADMVLNRTVAMCKEHLKNHLFLNDQTG